MNFIEISDFLDKTTCELIISSSLSLLTKSEVAGKYISGYRTSWQCLLDPRFLEEIEHKLELIVNIPPSFHESWRVIRYKVGEYYKPHYDWIPANLDYSNKMLSLGGQRTKTVIIYLSNVSTGGITNFPILSLSFKAEVGKLLVWDNTGKNGIPLINTLHEGTPPVSGEKWILTTWYRERAIREFS